MKTTKSNLKIIFILGLLGMSIIAQSQTTNTWISGSDSTNQKSNYGTLGVANTNNIPGARSVSISWTVNEELWLFGGYGIDSLGNFGEFNDLWKYDKGIGQWTWVSGSKSRNQMGNYGTLGVEDSSNIPGGRDGSISWNTTNTLWLFGGYGLDGSGNTGELNDLWKYNMVTGLWTWVSGSKNINKTGNYGTKGLGSTSNIPGCRDASISWTENDTLWLFGGYGYDSIGEAGALNDLWRYNITNGQWTWVSGSNYRNQTGNYGTLGVGNSGNCPAARYYSISWVQNDTLWLFGGTRIGDYLNDLWKFNKVNKEWTWVSGSNTSNQSGTYGTKGIGSTSNIPGARELSSSWIENNNLWLFGGRGKDRFGNTGKLNDLWKYNMVNGQWTWEMGSDTADRLGTYGTKGMGSSNNFPGARGSSNHWVVKDTLWLFGGNSANLFNDLWAIKTPCSAVQVNTQPIDAKLCVDGDTLFRINTSGEILSKKWQINQGIGWSDIGAETKDTILLKSVNMSQDGNQYRAVIYGICGNDTTNVVGLNVLDKPKITNLTSSKNPVVNGYTPYSCSNLTVTTVNNNNNFTYSWSPSGTGNPLNVCPNATTTYKVTVSDNVTGCADTMSINQAFVEATSPYSGRVLICYYYPNRGFNTLSVLPAQVPSYLNAGATFGPCTSKKNKSIGDAFDAFDGLYKIFPNPINNEIHLEFFNLFTEEINITLTDMTGKIVKTLYSGLVLEGQMSNIVVDATDLSNGMYMVRYSSNSDIRINKVQLMR